MQQNSQSWFEKLGLELEIAKSHQFNVYAEREAQTSCKHWPG